MAERPTKTKQDGTKIVDPDFSLKEKMRGANMEKVISDEKVKQATKVVEQDKASFSKDGMKATKVIQLHFDELRGAMREGKALEVDNPVMAALHDAVLNLKSQAGMYGYSLATEIARSLYGYCSGGEWNTERGLRIMEVHVDALHRVFAEDIQGDGGEKGKEMLAGFNAITT